MKHLLLAALLVVALAGGARGEDTNVTVRTGQTTELDALCTGSSSKVEAGSIGAALGSYPCETVRTDLALARLEGREGFTASTTRGFLRARLFVRGLGSVILGFIGLG